MKQLFFIDLFCGAGGVTTGIHRAMVDGERVAKVIACVNHDPLAIASHLQNHPDVLHYTEDIRKLDITELIAMVRKTRLQHPDAIICLWASLECTNFSKAKGGLPRDADSRTLADDLYKRKNAKTGKYTEPSYIQLIDPDYLWIENVEEFMSWGPLDKNGKPVSRKAGSDYLRWITDIQKLGYQFEHRILNAADYGAYTSRKRFFGQFAKHGLPIAWPVATYSKNPVNNWAGELKKWKAVRDVLDLKDTGVGIFERKKPLSDKTYERIYHGLIKFVAGGRDEFRSFIVKYLSLTSSGSAKNCSSNIDDIAPTVTTQNRLAMATVQFLNKNYSGKPQHKNSSINSVAGSITTADSQSLTSVKFINKTFSGKPHQKNISIDGPCSTIGTGFTPNVVSAEFLLNYHHSSKADDVNKPCPTLVCKDKLGFVTTYHGNGHNCTGLDTVSPTIPCKDSAALVQPFMMRDFTREPNCNSLDNPAGSICVTPKLNLVTPMIMNNYTNGGSNSSVDSPLGAITPVVKANLITPQWLMDTQYNNKGASLDNPAPVITANRKAFYLMNPQWFNKSASDINQPCFTLIARMDKAPPYLVEVEGGQIGIEVYENDSEYAVLIKEFMALYGIIDIRMRMLRIPELLRIQGFGDGYYLAGTQTDQKKFIGNSVEVNQAQKLIEASYQSIIENMKMKAA